MSARPRPSATALLRPLTDDLAAPARGGWGRRALTAAALAMTVCLTSAVTGLTPAHADATVTKTIGLGHRPYAVAFTPNGAQAYVTNLDDRSVSVIAVATGTVSKSISVGNSPSGVAFTPNGAQAYVTNLNNSSVSVIAVATGTVSKTIPVPLFPGKVAITPDGAQAYVTAWGPYDSTNRTFNYGSVSVIDVATGAISRTIPVKNKPEGVAITPNGAQAYVTHNNGSTITVIDVATGTVSKNIPTNGSVLQVAFSPDGAQAYLTNNSVGSVSVINVATGTFSKNILLGSQVGAVAFAPDGAQAYATNISGSANVPGNSVSVIDVATGTVSKTIPVGNGPFAVAFTPDGSQAYVPNTNDNTVSVLATGLVRSMTLSPSGASVPAGTAVTLTAQGYTSTTHTSSTDVGPVSPVYTTDSNGTVSGSTVTFTKAGNHTITAKLRKVSATTTVTVTPAALASITISPTSATVKSGDTLAFTTTGFDRYGNTRGPVTSDSAFTSDNRTDTVQGNAVRFGVVPGKRTITGTDGGFTATSVITEQVGPVPLPLPVWPIA